MFKRGFTLIELLVVVSIIGVLSSIVLSSLGEARTNAKNTRIKASMRSLQTQAELFYLDKGDYGQTYFGFCGGSAAVGAGDNIFLANEPDNFRELLLRIGEDIDINQMVCYALATSGTRAQTWFVRVPLVGGGNWCVDSIGTSGEGLGDWDGSCNN